MRARHAETPSRIDLLAQRAPACMLRDRRRIHSALARLRRKAPSARRDAELDQIAGQIERSTEAIRRRAAAVPKPAFPTDLPITGRLDEIAVAMAARQVVVVCGETGSGKSTQLPKLCLALGRGVTGTIGHTQPRRVAARAIAARVAEEIGTPLGRAVGFKVRFNDRVSADTLVKVMTDGILLAETQSDRDLEQYDTLIIDEAHERSLNIDFLLGYIRQLLPRRPDLKVIITSATIDPRRFSEHFGGAPVVEVSGRAWPVEVRWRPVQIEEGAAPYEQDRAVEAAVLAGVDEAAACGPGDVLVFLSGEREIREAAEALRKHHPPVTQILPLYARLSSAEQQRVFQPHPGRRIVLATNVAETSLTVPGVRFVVDPGFARISRYSHRTRLQRLPIEPVSRASADQRAGRCGRLGPGVCIRLYAEEDYAQRPRFTEPEILRTNLASVILQMKALRLGAVEEFPFIEPPDARMIRDGYETLREVNAVDERLELTPIGRDLARLPVDPRIGRIIVAADRENCLAEALIIASALSIQDPRERPMDAADKADESHAQFRHEESDFLTLLNIWAFFHEQKEHLSQSRLRKLCRERFLSFVRMREWVDTHQQLHELAAGMGRRGNAAPAEYAAIHRALLAGLLSRIARLEEKGEYVGVRGSKMRIFPGSALFRKSPKWIVAAEVVKTTKVYARTVARIEPGWIESVGAHLVKRTHSEPEWSSATGQAVTLERVSLLGLEIASGRRVPLGPIDAAQARDLFIQHALVEGDLRTRARFVAHNRALLDEVRALESKARRSDLLAEPEAVHGFYAARVPQGAWSGGAFERWRGEAERRDQRLLFMSRADAMRPDAPAIDPADFPDSMSVGGASLALAYRAEPGHEADGVTVTAPIEALFTLPAARLEWLVPGMVVEKITALIKALPKESRRSFVPAPDCAARCAKAMRFGEGSLLDAAAEALARMSGEPVPREAWTADALPAHLLMRVRVVGEDGRELAAGRDIGELRRRLRPEVEAAFARLAGDQFARDGILTWDFGELKDSVEVARSGLTVRGFPAIVDRGGSVSLRLMRSDAAAHAATRIGMRRLFLLQMSREIDFQVQSIPELREQALFFATLGGAADLRAGLSALIADRAFLFDYPPAPPGNPVRSRAQFEARLTEGWNRMTDAARQSRTLAGQILTAHHALALRLDSRAPGAWGEALADVREQMGRLLFKGFLEKTPWERLVHVPRYLKAIDTRVQKLSGAGAAGVARDQRASAEVVPFWRAWLAHEAGLSEEDRHDPALVEMRWMVEEFRVSLFAQELGTAAPASAKRLEKLWSEVKG